MSKRGHCLDELAEREQGGGMPRGQEETGGRVVTALGRISWRWFRSVCSLGKRPVVSFIGDKELSPAGVTAHGMGSPATKDSVPMGLWVDPWTPEEEEHQEVWAP